MYRDLKRENILIDSNETENNQFEDELPIIKVIDFGTAEIFAKDTLLSKQIGTPYYIAPEVLNNLYNEKCDLWSCGVIMFILLCGCPPFYGKNDQEIYKAIKSGKFDFSQKIWESVSQEAKNLITKLLDLDFDKRPTAEEAIKDPWFLLYEDNEGSGLIQHTSPTENNNNVNERNDANSNYNENNNFDSSLNNYNKKNDNNKNDGEIEKTFKSAKTMRNLYSNKNLFKNSNNNNLNEISDSSRNELNCGMLENSIKELSKKPNSNNKNIQKISSLNKNNNNNLKSSQRNKSNILNSAKKSKKESLVAELGLLEALNNLKNFRAERKLQLATLYFMVHTLVAKQDLKFIRDLFYNFDKDKDGRLTKEEIQKGFRSAKFSEFSEEAMQRLMNIIDMDCNGYIEYQEFIAATYDKKKILTEFNLKKAFDMFDKDKSGKISSEELKTVLGGGNEENDFVWEKIISEIDSDGDGEISYEEFKTMMYNLISSA